LQIIPVGCNHYFVAWQKPEFAVYAPPYFMIQKNVSLFSEILESGECYLENKQNFLPPLSPSFQAHSVEICAGLFR
jgi:hypothetical protein